MRGRNSPPFAQLPRKLFGDFVARKVVAERRTFFASAKDASAGSSVLSLICEKLATCTDDLQMQ